MGEINQELATICLTYLFFVQFKPEKPAHSRPESMTSADDSADDAEDDEFGPPFAMKPAFAEMGLRALFQLEPPRDISIHL